MFDPALWSSESFVDAVPIVTGERRIITMTIPAKVVVAITSIYVFNSDTADHDMNLELNLDISTLAAPFYSKQMMSGFADTLIPIEPLPGNVIKDTRAPSPLILSGPILFIVNDTMPLSSPFATMRFLINWLEAKFAVLASTPVVPVGVTV